MGPLRSHPRWSVPNWFRGLSPSGQDLCHVHCLVAWNQLHSPPSDPGKADGPHRWAESQKASWFQRATPQHPGGRREESHCQSPHFCRVSSDILRWGQKLWEDRAWEEWHNITLASPVPSASKTSTHFSPPRLCHLWSSLSVRPWMPLPLLSLTPPILQENKLFPHSSWRKL